MRLKLALVCFAYGVWLCAAQTENRKYYLVSFIITAIEVVCNQQK